MTKIAGIEELRAAGYVGYENGEFVKVRPKHKTMYEITVQYTVRQLARPRVGGLVREEN